MIRLNCDYLEGCHPSILEKLAATNLEQTPGYGTDHYCKEAANAIREAFSCRESAVHFLVGGTQANMTVIAAALRPYEGVLCAETGHINVHETGAIESTGHKCLALPHKDGLIAGSQVAVAAATQADDEHTVRPGMVYISMSTELGTMYNRSQLKDLYYTCKQLGLYLFIDGARLGYGLAAANCDLTPADVAKFSDVFTVGGTKMGALFGEAVVINNPELNVRFRYMIKQKGGMLAKGRLLGIQFLALMEDGLYFKTGRKAVDQAMRIREALMNAGFTFHVDSPTNQIFPIFTDAQWEKIEALGFKLEFNGRLDEEHVILRVCTSWCTPDEYVDKFIEAVKEL